MGQFFIWFCLFLAYISRCYEMIIIGFLIIYFRVCVLGLKLVQMVPGKRIHCYCLRAHEGLGFQILCNACSCELVAYSVPGFGDPNEYDTC